MRTAIGVDLGGTKIAAALVDERGRIVRREQAPTAPDEDGLFAAIAALVSRLDAPGAEGVGVGAAGIVEYPSGRYVYGPNLGLRDVEMAGVLRETLGARVVVDNDANAAAWAEHRFGSGRGTAHFLCVTLGTGIGGGIVIGGRPYRGARGGAGEIGHMLVDPSGPECGCGRRGCWEQFASGRALEREARDGIVHEPDSALYRLTGGDPSKLAGPMITAAARERDRFALSLLARLSRWVGVGLASLVNVLEPERICISGGLADDWDLLAEDTVRSLRENMEAPDHRPTPDVVAAELGSDAGVVGAAWMVLEDAG